MMKEAWQKGDLLRIILLSLLLLAISGIYALYIIYKTTYRCVRKICNINTKKPSYGRYEEWG